MLRILATITLPTCGKITWNGADIFKDPNTLRQTLGYLPQDFGVYPNLNAIEFLEYMAAIKGIQPRAAPRRLLRGMRQRIGIAQALLNAPQLLIVDEPTFAGGPAAFFLALVGALFIPSLALGCWSSSSRLFQAVYLLVGAFGPGLGAASALPCGKTTPFTLPNSATA